MQSTYIRQSDPSKRGLITKHTFKLSTVTLFQPPSTSISIRTPTASCYSSPCTANTHDIQLSFTLTFILNFLLRLQLANLKFCFKLGLVADTPRQSVKSRA